jgi:thiamine transporter
VDYKIHVGGFFMQSKTVSHAKAIAVGALCVALAFALNQVSIFRMPLGGSVTPFSMAFIVLAGYWLGPVYGILSGVALGLLDTITGATIIHPAQYLLDYILGFGMLGIGGLFRKWKWGLQIGYVAGVLGRYAMVTLSGVIFFYMYAPAGQHALIYSMIYNISYIGPEAVVSLAIISLPAMAAAINTVTKAVVPAETYAIMQKNSGATTATARLVSGTVLGILGGVAFAVSAYITRLTDHAITQAVTGHRLLTDAQYQVFRELDRDPHRLYRVIERGLEHTLVLNIAGVLLLAVGVALALSCVVYSEKTVEKP